MRGDRLGCCRGVDTLITGISSSWSVPAKVETIDALSMLISAPLGCEYEYESTGGPPARAQLPYLIDEALRVRLKSMSNSWGRFIIYKLCDRVGVRGDWYWTGRVEL